MCAQTVPRGLSNDPRYGGGMMRLVHPTSEWVEEYVRSHPHCTSRQITYAWYPPEVLRDHTACTRARGLIGSRLQLLRRWGIITRSDHNDHRRGEPALYVCVEGLGKCGRA